MEGARLDMLVSMSGARATDQPVLISLPPILLARTCADVDK